MTLTEFLLARIAEDEVAAHEAATIPHRAHPRSGEEVQNSAEVSGPGNWSWGGGPAGDGYAKLAESMGVEYEAPDERYHVHDPYMWDLEEPIGYRFDIATLPKDVTAARHIARWDPDRVLAECEAKRRIVKQTDGYDFAVLDAILMHLALPYADHPDFDSAWRL